MAFFPKIQSPCPYKGNLAAVIDGGMCRICQREVHDLTDWSDGERVAFLASCETEICVSYRIVRPALAAAALAAAVLPNMAAAQTQAPAPAAAPQPAVDEGIEVEITGGGITDPRNVEFVSEEELAATPAVPVQYEDETPASPKPAPSAKPGV